MTRLLTPFLLLITLNSFSQSDTVLNYKQRLTFDYISPTEMKIDTFNITGGYLPIKIQSGKMFILGWDTLEILHSFRRVDSAYIFYMQSRDIESIDTFWVETHPDSLMKEVIDTLYHYTFPIIGILRFFDDAMYFDIEYPKQGGNGNPLFVRTVMFVLPPKPPYSD